MTGSGATVVLERERGCPGRKMLQRKPSDAHIKSAQIQSHFKPLTHGGWGEWGGLGARGGLKGQQDWNTVKARQEISVAANCRTGRVGSFDPAKDQNPDRPHFVEVKTMPPEGMCHEAKYSNGTILTECKPN